MTDPSKVLRDFVPDREYREAWAEIARLRRRAIAGWKRAIHQAREARFWHGEWEFEMGIDRSTDKPDDVSGGNNE